MMMPIPPSALTLLLLPLVFAGTAGCSGADALRDAGAEELRIVSISPSLTELVFELGAGDDLVGVTRYCRYPPEALEKTPIGDFVHPNLELIVSLRPTLVLAERWTSSRNVARLRALDLNVFELESPHSLQEIYDRIREMGSLLEAEGSSERLIERLEERVREAEARSRRLEPAPTVYVEIDLPTWTIGGRSFTSQAVRLAGARNIFEDVDRPSLQASREVVIERDPEVILSFEADAGEIARRPGWSRIRAVREGRVVDDFDTELLSRANHRLVEGIERFQEELLRLYGEGKARETGRTAR